MLKALFSLVFAAVMWVQVPQWQPDWSQCSVDTPDVDCHWYVTAPDLSLIHISEPTRPY